MLMVESHMDIRTDRAQVPADRAVTRYLLVSVTAPERERRRDRPSVEVALVLDRSGSMAGQKIDMARRAVQHAIRLLDTRDRVALVCYDTEVDTLLGSTSATAEAKTLALKRLTGIDARGGTDLCAGWLRGAEELAPRTADEPAAEPSPLRRVLLLSDGQANEGETDPVQLARHAAALREQGIATSTFGIGADFDEVLMSRLATEGGGHFYYIEQPAQIPDFLASELGDTLDVVARDARLIVAGSAGVVTTCLSGFATDADDNRLTVRLGDLVAGQQVTLILAVRTTGDPSATPAVSLRLTDRDAALFPQPMPIEWQVVDTGTDATQAVSLPVLEAVAETMADRARAAALDANRHGKWTDAEAIITRAVADIRALAPGAPSLERIASTLEARLGAFTEAMSSATLKSEHFSAYAALSTRTPEGRARRR
jgi:Ca-activated chloride channel family protein